MDQRYYEAFDRLKSLGYDLFLLSDGSFEPREGYFEEYYRHDLRKTKLILDFFQKIPIKFDAVTMQFSDFLTPLVSLLARQFGCIGNSPETAFCCRSKYHMRKRLEEKGVPSPKFCLCHDFEELKAGIEKIGIPCVAKPIGGNGSYGTFLVSSDMTEVQIKEAYDKSISFLKGKSLHEDIFAFTKEELGLFGVEDSVDMVCDYLVEEYMAGHEISVDALVQNGEVTIMGIEEQIRMEPPYFVQLAGRMPYECDSAKLSVIEALIKKTISAMGIKNSATHTEIIFTSEGPKIVEIGCRFGGDDIHDKIIHITGYNMMLELVMIALGVKRDFEIKTICHTYMEYLLPHKKGILKKVILPPELYSSPEVIEIFLFSKEGDPVSPPPDSFDFLGYLVTKGATPHEAEENMKKVMKQIQVIIA